MVSIRSLAAAAVASAALSTAAVTPEASKMSARTAGVFSLTAYGGGDCSSQIGSTHTVTPGQCVSVGGTAFGAALNYENQHCVIKFWQNSDCSGKPNTFYAPPNHNTGCFAAGNQGGLFVLTTGAKSFIANCAQDQV